jgi:phage tail sheath gpL-like
MAIDATARARVLGVEAQFRDFRSGAVENLPQRVYVVGQGQTGVTYPSTKFVAQSANAVGARFGYKSPLYLTARELLPQNGDGVGTIPVTFCPLSDAVSSAAAVGGISVSGTLTQASAYRLRAGGVQSDPFALPKTGIAVDNSFALGAIYDAIKGVLHFPYTLTFTFGTVTAGALQLNGTAGGTGNGTITALSVTGNPRPGVYKLSLKTVVANGGVWTLYDPTGALVADNLTMTPGVGGVTPFTPGGVNFSLTDGTTDFGTVGSYFQITVPATAGVLTSGWKGLSANDLKLEIIGDANGAVFTITQPTGGLVNPSVQPALDQIGLIWETTVLNCLNIDDTSALDAISVYGEGRWGATVMKPFVAFTGCTKPLAGDAVAVSSLRPTDRVNAQLVSPGSPDLPCRVAARQLARIVKLANNNPPTDYGAQRADGLVAGTDQQQWDYPTRDYAMKNGSSTIEIADGVVSLSDVITFYHPTGDADPAYRYVVDIVKLQNIIYNLQLIFAAQEWAGAPLIPDDQATTNPNARKPKQAKAAVALMLDNLGAAAIISDPKTAKKNTFAGINSQNPKRLDVTVPVQLSGNTNVKSVDLAFGFFYQAAPTA